MESDEFLSAAKNIIEKLRRNADVSDADLDSLASLAAGMDPKTGLDFTVVAAEISEVARGQGPNRLSTITNHLNEVIFRLKQ